MEPDHDPSVAQPPQEPSHAAKTYIITILTVVIIAIIVAVILFFTMFRGSIQEYSNNQKYDEGLAPVQDKFIAGDYGGAVTESERVVSDRGGEDLGSLISLARAYLEQGNASFEEETYARKALTVADKILEIAPDHPEAYRIKGYAHEITERYEEAIVFYNKAIELDAEFPLAVSQLGHTYELMGEREKAIEYYEKALAIEPKHEHALLNLADMHYSQGNFEVARGLLDSFMEVAVMNVAFSRGLTLYGLIALEEGQYLDAVTYFEESLDRDPISTHAWTALSSAYFGLFNATEEGSEEEQMYVEKITKATDRALEIHSDDTYALINKGNLKFAFEDCDGADIYYDQALNAIPKDITLGAFEKREAQQYIESVKKECRLLDNTQ